MTANILQEKPFSGWMALAGVMVAYFGICGNVSYAFGVLLPVMAEAFGWKRQAISGAYTFFLILGGLIGPLAGWSVARFGARRNIVLGNIVAVIGLLGMSQVRELWHVYLCFGFLCGIALGFSEYLPTTTVVNHWFIRRRSLALGASSGFRRRWRLFYASGDQLSDAAYGLALGVGMPCRLSTADGHWSGRSPDSQHA